MKISQQKEFAKVLLQRFGPAIEEWRDKREAAKPENRIAYNLRRLDKSVLLPPSKNIVDGVDKQSSAFRRRVTSDTSLPK